MSTKNSPSYNRAPSPELQKLISPGGFLAPLLVKRKVAGCELDVHFRLNEEVHVYCGLTRLVNVKLYKRYKSGTIRAEAHGTYAKQQGANRLFRPESVKEVKDGKYLCDVWSANESGFADALDAYLCSVEVDKRQIKEGTVQSRWSRVTEPWIPFDKEAFLRYASKEDAVEFRKFAKVDEAYAELESIAESHHWAQPKKPGCKLDQLAVDSTGNLVLVEIKDASASRKSDVYYAPFQLLQYVWEWYSALDAVRNSLQKLLDARMVLGLTSAHAPRLTGGIRAAVGFGADDRSDEVKRRYDKVLDIVNKYLPPGVPSVETWILDEQNQPARLHL